MSSIQLLFTGLQCGAGNVQQSLVEFLKRVGPPAEGIGKDSEMNKGGEALPLEDIKLPVENKKSKKVKNDTSDPTTRGPSSMLFDPHRRLDSSLLCGRRSCG